MRVGLFSDVHTDITSLQKTIEFLRGQAVDEIYCLGDLVELGRGDSDKIVEFIQAAEIPAIQGNHDEYTVNFYAREIREGSTEKMPKAETLEYLQNLPERLRFNWEGVRVLLYHGTWMSLSTDSPDHFFVKIAERIIETEVDILIMGHTHMPMNIICKGVRFLNPGAVTARQGGVFCGILTLPEFKFEVWNVTTGEILDLPLLEINLID